jgi:hypothetical protein
MQLSVMCGRRIDRYRSGCSGHVLPGGRLRIVDPTRGVVATYSSARWTILTAPSISGDDQLIDWSAPKSSAAH